MLKIVGTSLSQLRSSAKAKYALAVVVVVGILAIIPLSVQLSQESREDRSSASGQEGTGVISGTIYDDKNYNGVMNEGDPGLQKFTSIGFPVVIELVETGPTISQPIIKEAYADESGKYQFQEITFNADNTYAVRVKPETGADIQYAPTSSDTIKATGPGTINFGFGSLTAIQTDVPADMCSISYIPPSPNAATTQFLKVFVRTNPSLPVPPNHSYETTAAVTGDKYGAFPSGTAVTRVFPNSTYKQMVTVYNVNAYSLLHNPSAPQGQASNEFNLKRNGRFECALTLKNGPTVVWTHTNNSNFDVMEARLGEFYWNGAVPTAAQGCNVDINVNPSQIASNQTAQINWSSQNVYGNCEASGTWTGTVPAKGSQSSGPPGQFMREGSYTYNITCKNADNVSCSDNAVLTVGSGSTNVSPTTLPTPFPTVVPTIGNTSATPSAEIAIAPSTGTYPVGSTFTVQVVTSSKQDANVAKVSITYPPSKVDFLGISYEGSPFGIKAQETLGNGLITIARGAQAPVFGNAVLAELTFRVKAGPIPLTLSNAQFVSSATSQNIPVRTQNAIFGVIVPTNTPTPFITRTPTLFVDPLPTSTPRVVQSGDLNEDGVINLNDLSILLNAFGTSNRIADLNRDGKVNIFDLSMLLSQMRQ